MTCRMEMTHSIDYLYNLATSSFDLKRIMTSHRGGADFHSCDILARVDCDILA